MGTTTDGRRTTGRRLLLAGALGLGLLAAGTAAGPAQTAGAAGSTYTYAASGSQPGPLPASYSSGSASDGWAAAVSATQVFNVSHHEGTLKIACHNQSDARPCWTGTKRVTGSGVDFATPAGAGLYLNQTNGRLYTFAINTSTNAAGVVCINTALAPTATGAQMFCGFTALTGSDAYYVSPAVTGNVADTGLSAPVLVGTSWYAFNAYPGSTTGSRNKLLCFSVATFTPCTAQPFAVDLGGQAVAPFQQPSPIGAAGTSVFVQVAGTTADVLACITTTTNTPCTGAWPVTVASPASATAFGGPPIPLRDTGGNVLGACLGTASLPCFTTAGAPTAAPAAMVAAIGAHFGGGQADSDAPVVIANAVYVPVVQYTQVACFNFTTQANCPNFPKQLSNLSLLYSVNTDPQRPTCLWVNSDSGGAQIQNFDAITGGSCTRGSVRIQTNALASTDATCTPNSFTSLQITSPARGAYASASVAFQDALGNTLGVPAASVDAFGGVDLSGLALQTRTAYPQFVVTFSGLSSTPATVSYRLTWGSAGYSLSCISAGQSVSSVAGYWMVSSDGGIFNYGNAGFYGSAGALPLNKPIVGMAALPCRCGYWLVASDGGIFAYGYAGFYGSTGAIALNKPIVGMAVTPTGNGYWLVASDGGIFAFGDARFFGSTGALSLNKPIVGMATTPDGGGYWLVASDGGIFAYGDAAFYGSTGAIALNKPIVGMAANPNGGGYWMVASDGGIFAFGNAGFYGSTGALRLNKPIVGMAPSPFGKGYWLVASDGGIFSFGDARFAGSAGSLSLNKPIVAMTA